MRNLILLSVLILAGCQQQQEGTPKSWKEHCAAVAEVRVSRQMNTAYRQGSAYNVEAEKRRIQNECLKRLEQEKKSRSQGSQP